MKFERIISHRGASAYAPENTLAAFKLAKDLGSKIIEFDISQSIDGELFVFHDENLNRTTNGEGAIHLREAAYINSLDAGIWFASKYIGIKIPTFKETISWLLQNDMQANIEIKPFHDAERITKAVLHELDLYWPRDKTLPIISSFNYEALKICNKIKPHLTLALLLDSWPDSWLDLARNINCKMINISKKIASRKIVNKIKKNGFEVNVYTVNNCRVANKMFAWGVSAVFSDYPDLISYNK